MQWSSEFCRKSTMTYLVCSPTKIICSNVSLLSRVVCMEIPYIILGLKVSRNIQLVLTNRWRCPASALERIEHPASPVVLARVLIARHFSMDLNHCVPNVLDMLFVREGSKPKTEVPTRIACQHDTWTSCIEVVAGVADRPYSRNVRCCRTTANYW